MHKSLGVTLILSTIFLAGCGKEISKEFLVISNGKFYEQGSHEPYSGTVLNDSPYGPGLRFLPIDPTVKVSCISRMSDGVYDGQFTCKDNDTGNSVLELSFKNGKQQGKRTVYNSKTKDLIEVSNWENGVLNGEELRYVDGKKLCQTEYRNGKIHGKQVCWGAASYKDSSTWSSAYFRLKTFSDDEITIDANFENGEIVSGLFTSASWASASNGITYWVNQQGFSKGMTNEKSVSDGKLEYFKVFSGDIMNRFPIAKAEYKNGLLTGKATFYAADGKSICSEKIYDNGVPVTGYLNIYTKNGDFVSEVKLVKHNTKNAFVFDGNVKEIEKYEDRDYQCKTTESTWEKGVRLKRVSTNYSGRNFDTVSNVSVEELIKESVSNKEPNIQLLDSESVAFCSDSMNGGLGSDITAIDHHLYTSKIIKYENNVPIEETACPYGSKDSDGCITKSLLSDEEQQKIQEQEQVREQERAQKQAQEQAQQQAQEQAQSRAQERERYLAASLSSTDDCSTYLETAGITVKINDSLDMGEKTQISIMFSNTSKDNYEVPVVRVGSCEFVNRAAILPEMSEIKAGETITQSYLCGADFMNNDLPVKMYLKYPGAVTATSACTTIPSQSPSETESLKVKEGDGHRSASFPSPSFDCAKAGTSIEKLICSDSHIGNLDGMLGQHYKALFGDKYGFDEEGKKSTKDEQKAWVAKRNACTTKECVIAAYKSRIDEICEIPVAIGVNDCQSWVSLGEANP